MFDNSIADIFAKGGFVLIILIICSILSLGVIIFKFLEFKVLNKKYIDDFKMRIASAIRARDIKEAEYICGLYKVKVWSLTVTFPLASVYAYIFHNHNLNRDILYEKAIKKLDLEFLKLDKGLGILSTLGPVSPFIGLFGTVLGIIKAFQSLSLSQTEGYFSVMSGIAEALIATAAGLVVAIPATMFFNYFRRRLRNSLPYFEEAVDDLILQLKKKEEQVV